MDHPQLGTAASWCDQHALFDDERPSQLPEEDLEMEGGAKGQKSLITYYYITLDQIIISVDQFNFNLQYVIRKDTLVVKCREWPLNIKSVPLHECFCES